MSTLLRLVAALLVSTLVTGCGVPWTVIRESGPPSALKGVEPIDVAFHYDETVVEGKPIDRWVADKTAEDPEYPITWADLLGRLESHYVRGLKDVAEATVSVAGERGDGGASEGVGLDVHVVSMELGKWIPFALPPTIVDVRMVWNVDGRATDEIGASARMSPSAIYASVFQHIGPVGQRLGRIGAEFYNAKQEDEE